MAQFGEALQISIISIAIVFASLLVFSFLIQLMGSYFQRAEEEKKRIESTQPVKQVGSATKANSLMERKKIAAIMTVFQEEFGDQIAEIKISRVK